MSELQPGDKRAAFTGLIVTAILLFLIAFTTSKLTTVAHGGGESHAEATK